ncbi:tripartite tricarboxylate transporter TctB family protein [Microvirga sp. ACRRW]|uniref:tripartite tricarboxylate transporter TctB family protein n=1 Tax=Microvirga sp. ACRRW TaxID=2918205 RepID=UPI001EF4E6CC|nr:tripartite tricarboxylate transporter TctB family protein [Microvirga sp. ACRRW]MCG7391621.1 tripartite tricarboxylate transporter TctB family protein [Microvirga sp. ACRRW]
MNVRHVPKTWRTPILPRHASRNGKDERAFPDSAMRIVRQKDFVTGLLYIALGVAFAVASYGYRMGTASRMGPGYFPFWLGVLLAAIGVMVLWGSLRLHAEPEKLQRWAVRPMLIILASVFIFGAMLETLGLVLSLIVLIVGSSLASPEFTWRSTIINTVALIVFAVVVFVYSLSLQFPVWPTFIAG